MQHTSGSDVKGGCSGSNIGSLITSIGFWGVPGYIYCRAQLGAWRIVRSSRWHSILYIYI